MTELAGGRVEEVRRDAGTCVLAVVGDADLHLAPQLRARLEDCVDGVRSVVVDLTHATLLDSIALGVLVREAKRLRPAGVQVRLVVPQPQLRRIFEITLLDRLLEIHATGADAISAAQDDELPASSARAS